VVAATPYTDMVYGAVTANWLNIRPMPERWLSSLASYLPEAHNNLVEEFLSLPDRPDRLLILEDDLAVQPEIIARCRTHRADVVSGLYFARRAGPLAFGGFAVPSGSAEPARIPQQQRGRRRVRKWEV
jgi:hypothetical protein